MKYEEPTLRQIWNWFKIWMGWASIMDTEINQTLTTLTQEQNILTKEIFQNFSITIQPSQVYKDIDRKGLDATIAEGQLRLKNVILDINARRTR